MNHVREIAKSIITEMQNARIECGTVDVIHFKRLAILAYADALKFSPVRSREMTEQCIQEAYVYAEKAISCGVNEERMSESFTRLRNYWLPRLKEVTDAC